MRVLITILALFLALPCVTRVAHAVVEFRSVPISFGKVDGQDVVSECVVYYDPAIKTPRPAILVFPEWWGLNDYSKGRARQLAEMGYVALAVDMYGGAKTTRDFAEAGKLATPFYKDRTLFRTRANRAIEVLRKLQEVDGKRVGAIGFCFGGTAALELGRSGADLSAIVSFHGDPSNPEPSNAANIKAHVLLLHGTLDPMVKQEAIAAFKEEMNAAGIDYVVMEFAKAVHAFTNPNAGNDPSKGLAYNADAERRSWQAMKNFLQETIGAPVVGATPRMMEKANEPAGR